MSWATLVVCVQAGDRDASAPRRIIVIGPNIAEVVCALGDCDRIIGVDRFCSYPPDLQKRARVGGLFDPDLEAMISLNPDLVMLRGRNLAIEELCARRAIPLYLDGTERLADIERSLTLIGTRLGRQVEAERAAADFRRRLERVRARVESLDRPRVLLVVSRRSDAVANVMTAAKGTFVHDVLEIAGGENVFGSLDMAYPSVSVEAILERQPEVVVEFLPELENSEEARGGIVEQWQKLGRFPAARTGRIYLITEDNALIPSPRYIEIVEKLAELLHPH